MLWQNVFVKNFQTFVSPSELFFLFQKHKRININILQEKRLSTCNYIKILCINLKKNWCENIEMIRRLSGQWVSTNRKWLLDVFLYCTLTEYLPGAYKWWEYGFPATLHGDRDGDDGVANNVIRGDNSAHSTARSSSKCSKMSR